MNKYAIIVSSLVFLLSSCISMREVTLDQLKPAEISFPDQLKSVAVVSTIPHNSLDSINFTDKTTIVGDQKISKDIIAKRIADAHYFEKVIVCDSVIKDYLYESNNNLTSESVKELLSEFYADMIISLDKMNISIDKLYTSQTEHPIEVIRFITKPEIKFYISKKSAPIYTVTKSDTTFYNAYDLLDHETALLYAYDDAIKKNIDLVLPHWQQAVRYYYTGGSYEMRDAEVAVRENSWDSAYKLWSTVYQNRKGKLRNYAAFNIALYYELKDNISEAIKWLDLAEEKTSKESDFYQFIQMYKKILSDRDNELSKLKLQMNRFN